MITIIIVGLILFAAGVSWTLLHDKHKDIKQKKYENAVAAKAARDQEIRDMLAIKAKKPAPVKKNAAKITKKTGQSEYMTVQELIDRIEKLQKKKK